LTDLTNSGDSILHYVIICIKEKQRGYYIA